jgi:hypothetical protein
MQWYAGSPQWCWAVRVSVGRSSDCRRPNLGGAASASTVPSAIGCSETQGLYLRAPRVEVVSMARLQKTRKIKVAEMTRRKSSSGWWLRFVDVLLEPGRKRVPKHVSEVPKYKRERKGPERELEVDGGHRNCRQSSSETTALRAPLRAAWWRFSGIEWGNAKEGEGFL